MAKNRFLVKLQAEELQVHAEELSKVWRQLDEERETRIRLEKQFLLQSGNPMVSYFCTTKQSFIWLEAFLSS